MQGLVSLGYEISKVILRSILTEFAKGDHDIVALGKLEQKCSWINLCKVMDCVQETHFTAYVSPEF